jgi:hypothetical protein
MMKIHYYLLLAIVGYGFVESTAVSAANVDLGPWSAMFYCGSTAKESFGQIISGKYSRFGENIYVTEISYTLDQKNLIRRLFKPLFDTVQVAGNFAYRHDYVRHDDTKEGNLYLVWRWTKFPWGRYLSNSFAIGDGLSYSSHSPYADRGEGKLASDYSKFLNYLMLEATFALPAKPELQLVFRMHHRCTVWGTYPKKANAGSTSLGFGVRYYF